MLIQPVDYLVVWFMLAIGSPFYMGVDQYRKNPEPVVMIALWFDNIVDGCRSEIWPLAAIRFPSISPTVVRVGPLAIRWYGIAYLTGFLLAYLGLRSMIRHKTLQLSMDQLSDVVGWLIVCVMVGGRTGWWLVYHRGSAQPEPWYEPVAIWHGGMSFHGGLAGVAIGLAVWCWRNDAAFWNVADGVALVAPYGLFFGRIANFLNAELAGRPTTMPWGVVFPGDSVPRHPSQLYEALLEGPLLFALLWVAKKAAHPITGSLSALFLILYGVIRFWVEFLRQPDQQLGFIAFGWLTMGQSLSIVIVLAGTALWIGLNHRR